MKINSCQSCMPCRIDMSKPHNDTPSVCARVGAIRRTVPYRPQSLALYIGSSSIGYYFCPVEFILVAWDTVDCLLTRLLVVGLGVVSVWCHSPHALYYARLWSPITEMHSSLFEMRPARHKFAYFTLLFIETYSKCGQLCLWAHCDINIADWIIKIELTIAKMEWMHD